MISVCPLDVPPPVMVAGNGYATIFSPCSFTNAELPANENGKLAEKCFTHTQRQKKNTVKNTQIKRVQRISVMKLQSSLIEPYDQSNLPD